ncbi:hypothetical protein [Nonlabens ulvanivorans]|uniref:Outer membrane protein beta-barrel domain-containing protein n=1 Tax=Nonlabens ulvanivorans TaxID=906888 RepID=A0A084JW87_NONUL|nr:hypothetical protein [Nonlabens ulvanivorans]KEZ93221.1 hypothetical protein IL45_13965 [Nonlabens ulvanivorans]PRX13657.1 hypothetical protein LY02_01902 [Nonlabens ulvanivorans]
MVTNKEIGSSINDKLKSLNATPSDKVWKELERDLKKKKRKRLIPFWFWITGIGILFVGFLFNGLIFNFFLNNYSNKDFNELPIVDYQTDKAGNKFKSKDQKGLSSTDFKSSQDSLISNQVLLEENEGPVNKNFNGPIYVNQTIFKNTASKAKNILDTQITSNSEFDRVGRGDAKSNDILLKSTNTIVDDKLREIKTAIDSSANKFEDLLEHNEDSLTKKKNSFKLEMNEKKDSLKEIYKNPWSVSVSGIINRYNISNGESVIDRRLNDNQIDRDIQLNYGIALHHNLYNRWTLRVGANLIKYNQSTRNIDSNIINFESLEHISYDVDQQILNNFIAASSTIEIRQKYTYLEIPIQARYSLINGNTDLATILGFQNRLLLNDQTFLNSKSKELLIGKSNNVYDYGVSVHLSLASRIHLYKKLYFNVEPAIYYHIQPFDNRGINLLSEFRLTTSLEYKF